MMGVSHTLFNDLLSVHLCCLWLLRVTRNTDVKGGCEMMQWLRVAAPMQPGTPFPAPSKKLGILQIPVLQL